VLHGISLPPGEFGGPWIARLFTGNLPAEAHPEFLERAALRVSAHLLLRRSGEIVQFVSFNERAWHAGRSAWQGREACNDYSIGIECEGTDDLPYEPAQYQTLRAVLPMLLEAYPQITRERVVGTATSHRAARRIPGCLSTGRRCVDSGKLGGFHVQEIAARRCGLSALGDRHGWCGAAVSPALTRTSARMRMAASKYATGGAMTSRSRCIPSQRCDHVRIASGDTQKVYKVSRNCGAGRRLAVRADAEYDGRNIRAIALSDGSGYLPRSCRQRTSEPFSCRASTRASTNNRSDRRFRYLALRH
jgi:AmpD protein